MPLTANQLKLIVITVLFSLISACSNLKDPSMDPNAGRYSLTHDKMPHLPLDVDAVPNATPKYEPYSRRGNNDYRVYGKNYEIISPKNGFSQIGIASWYGAKFHGHDTSNGESYDMYSMSGAHKTLPLPSYAKITNLENNKTAIIRINDRGPFHANRIVDLSYAAAYKLDMLKTGTAKVKLEVIYIDITQASPKDITDMHENNPYYIQLVASTDAASVQAMAQVIEQQYPIKTRVQAVNNLFKLQLGPIGQPELAEILLEKMQQDGHSQSFIVQE